MWRSTLHLRVDQHHRGFLEIYLNRYIKEELIQKQQIWKHLNIYNYISKLYTYCKFSLKLHYLLLCGSYDPPQFYFEGLK